MTEALAIDDPQKLRTQLAELAGRCVDEALKLGASAAEVGASTSAGLSVTARLREVETIEHIRDKGIGITVFFGHQKGSASTSDFSTDALTETVASACAIAKHTGTDEFSGLANAELMATNFPDLDLYHPWDISPESAIELALSAEAAALDADPLISNSDGASVGSHDSAHAYANSHGFVATRSSTRHSLSVRCIAGTGEDMQRDYWYDTARSTTDMASAAEIGATAAARSIARLTPRKVPTGQYPVLMPPDVSASLIGHFVGAIRGGSLYRKASFLLDHKGKQVFAPAIRIHEQPHLPRAAGSTAYDNDGVATKPRDLVVDGVLQDYVLDSYAARRLGLQTTANAGGVHNLTVAPSDNTFDDLIKQMGTGIIVAELMGMGVNLLTGDYSRGASGFWVQNGELQHPIEEFTIAGNLRDIFMGIAVVGSDVDTRGNIRTGSFLVNGLTIAGES